MRTKICFNVIIALSTLAALPHHGGCAPTNANTGNTSPDTVAEAKAGHWEKDIQAFEEEDKKTPPLSDAALFIGSSSIRLWSTLAQDFSEIPVINRGFGGSRIVHSTRYAERIVLPYKPRLIVLYSGGNDVEKGRTPSQVLAAFKAFVAKVRTGLPDTPIAFISINPSLARWDDHDKITEANHLIAKYIKDQPKLAFIDSYSAMLGADGKPKKSLLRADGLHLSKEGYKVWTSIVKPPILTLYKEAKPKTAQ